MLCAVTHGFLALCRQSTGRTPAGRGVHSSEPYGEKPSKTDVIRFPLGLVWQIMHLVASLMYVASRKCQREPGERIDCPEGGSDTRGFPGSVRDRPALEIDNLVSATGTHTQFREISDQSNKSSSSDPF